MKVITAVTIAILALIFQSCEYIPYRGLQPYYITSTVSSDESKDLGVYMAQYIPVDTLVEYHDSLIDIKFNIVEAYLENGFREVCRFPPDGKKHYRIDQYYYSFVMIVDIDTMSTINIPDTSEWWQIGFLSLHNKAVNVIIRTPHLARISPTPRLDTLEIPVFLGYTYCDQVWPENKNEYVMIKKVQFFLNDTNFQNNKIYTFSSAKDLLEYVFKRNKKIGIEYEKLVRTVSEMDSMYSRVQSKGSDGTDLW